eukprot:gene11920-biopygen9453
MDLRRRRRRENGFPAPQTAPCFAASIQIRSDQNVRRGGKTDGWKGGTAWRWKSAARTPPPPPLRAQDGDGKVTTAEFAALASCSAGWAHALGSQDKPAPRPRHARATPATCPRHARATQAKKLPIARATPAPPKPNIAYSARHVRAMPAPRPRKCPVTPGRGKRISRWPVRDAPAVPKKH